jgi:hypothetical protein
MEFSFYPYTNKGNAGSIEISNQDQKEQQNKHPVAIWKLLTHNLEFY